MPKAGPVRGVCRGAVIRTHGGTYGIVSVGVGTIVAGAGVGGQVGGSTGEHYRCLQFDPLARLERRKSLASGGLLRRTEKINLLMQRDPLAPPGPGTGPLGDDAARNDRPA